MRQLKSSTTLNGRKKQKLSDTENHPLSQSNNIQAPIFSQIPLSDTPQSIISRSLLTTPLSHGKYVLRRNTIENNNISDLNSTPQSGVTNVSSYPMSVSKFGILSSISPQSNITNVVGSSSGITLSGSNRPTKMPLGRVDKQPLVDITNVHETLNGQQRSFAGNVIMSSKITDMDIEARDLSTAFEEEYNVGPTEQNNDYAHYDDLGDPNNVCEYCGAIFWNGERIKKTNKTVVPKYSKCCYQGQVILPKMKDPPPTLQSLCFGDSDKNKYFLQNIRSYNNMLCFTSMGGKVDRSINTGNAPPVFRISGQNYHMIGILVPINGATPKFAQLYIYDTHNEVQNRINSVRPDGNSKGIHDEIVVDLKNTLDQNNVLVNSFRFARDVIEEKPTVDVKMKLIGKRSKDGRNYNLPTASEVAALILGDLDPSVGDLDILIESKTGRLKKINQLNPAYLPLQYPVLFPYGEDGYRDDVIRNDGSGLRKRISPREYFSFYMHERINHVATLLYSRRLFQQYEVDGYTMVESARLVYIRLHQKALRCDSYKGLSDALTHGEVNPDTTGRRIILPSSFTGGARYMIQNYQDAMAICKYIGYPHLFITFTCNPKWPEIERYVSQRGLKAEDRPDIVCRVFKMKLDAMIQDIKKNKLFGEILAVIYTIEFQKRGLPHAHILLFANRIGRQCAVNEIDNFISAEIPNPVDDPEYHGAVIDFMIHGPCGQLNKKSPCMVDGKCSKYFPKRFVDETILDKDGYPVYRHRDNSITIEKNGSHLDNRHVVPHNRYLLLKYRAHINVEWCNQSRSIKYLFKYVNKGNDRVTAEFMRSSSANSHDQVVDEINMFYDCRYISSCEAMWHLFSFEIHYRTPPVERLSFHLEQEHTIFFDDDQPVEDAVEKQTIAHSQFKAWFDANSKYEEAKTLTYGEIPSKFVWKKDVREWHPRKKGFSIGRMFYVPPGCGELYYLRCLLNQVRGPMSYDDIRTVAGVLYNSFRHACYASGMLDDDREYIDAITEASFWATACALLRLFAILLTSSSIGRPEVVWNVVWQFLSEDAQLHRRRVLRDPELIISDTDKKQFALVELERLLLFFGKGLKDYPEMPIPDHNSAGRSENVLLLEELSYDKEALKIQHETLFRKLTEEQKYMYDSVINDVYSNGGGLFFVYGYGGIGKTFVWNTLSSKIRSEGDIVLNVASSGIASLLLPGGRTAHSRFAIPIDVHEDSTCNIPHGSDLAELIIRCKLIIWDESPMTHRHCFEALDKTMRDLLRFTVDGSAGKTFGGKTVVFGGDFRQILPVIPKGTRQIIVGASINSSYLWNNCKVLRLTKNLRLQSLSSDEDIQEIEWFSKWIADIGDGSVGGPNNGITEIDIPKQFLIKSGSDPIATIVESTFPMARSGMLDPSMLEGRAILSPTLDVVDQVNEYMSEMNTAEGRTYISSDSMCRSDAGVDNLDDIHTPEFLNSLRCSGIPNHSLTLKIGSPVILMRNIDHSLGLCNGTRLIITRLSDHVVEAMISTGTKKGTKVLIPRMTLIPSDPRLPFKFQRRQFPIMLAYAMTINKSQGQTLTHVGLLLKKPVFNHDQLYVAFSRVNNPKGLKILALDDNGQSTLSTTNVVYKEVFNNL